MTKNWGEKLALASGLCCLVAGCDIAPPAQVAKAPDVALGAAALPGNVEGPQAPSSLKVDESFDYALSRTVTLQSTVFDPEDKPYVGVPMAVYAPDETVFTPESAIAHGVTDAQGHFDAVLSVPSRFAELKVISGAIGIPNSKVETIVDGRVNIELNREAVPDQDIVAQPSDVAYRLMQAALLPWRYLAPEGYPKGYDAAGIPNAINDIAKKAYPADFFSRVIAALPERVDIRKSNPKAIANDDSATLALKEEADVFVTFLHEGAGYRNSLGFFTFNDGSKPTQRSAVQSTVAFPNASFSNSGGGSRGLASGQTLKLGRFAAGTRMGFVVAANGFDGNTGVKASMNPYWVFYSLQGLNSESNPELRPHTVMLKDDLTGQVVLGIEDILRTESGCDHDFNDAMFTLSVNPPTALNDTNLVELPSAVDTDKDKVFDANDDFPTDATRAFKTVVPAGGGLNTLAFEDNWPKQGDYDLNDQVVRYRYELQKNANGDVTDVLAHYELVAAGAAFHNGFALNFPGLAPSAAKGAKLKVGGAAALAWSPEAGASTLTYRVFNDSYKYTPRTKECAYYATEAGCAADTAASFDLAINFATPVPVAKLGQAPFNPFIYRSEDRGLEIHLPDRPPTSLARTSLFGTEADGTKVSTQRYYKSTANLPWALDIPSSWRYPAEYIPVTVAYWKFKSWAESSGKLNPGWYLNAEQGDKLYK